jgi:2-oxoglutarate ferredoxin oxidoreductase subunit beta
MSNPIETVFKPADYKTDVHSDWCPGCGDFGILNSLTQALFELKLEPWKVMVFSGIGCSGKTPHFVKTYGCHTLHGRSLPFAVGAKLSNPELTVIATGGDGDGYGIGVGHFVHSGRRNVDMTYIVFNNEVYGLTKGQAAPTLGRGQQTKSLPLPNINEGINPLAIALSAGYTFIARSYAYDGKHLREMIKQAILHKGMALVDVLQPCPTYNDIHTKEWFGGEMEIDGIKLPRVYKLEDIQYDGRVKDPENQDEMNEKRRQAFEISQVQGDRFALGVFYQIELPTYYERIAVSSPILKESTPVRLAIEDPKTHRPTTDLSKIYQDLTV